MEPCSSDSNCTLERQWWEFKSKHMDKVLFFKGYRVLDVEQTETLEQLEVHRKEKGSKDKVVRREICVVVTKGTITEGERVSSNPEASYLLAMTESCQTSANQQERIFGICVVDVATSKIILGQFQDDPECSTLCCLLSELRPVEIIKPAKMLSPETERVLLRHTISPLVNEWVPLLEFWERKLFLKSRLYTEYGDSFFQAADSLPHLMFL